MTVLNNKKLVATIADTLRDDAMMNPTFFFGQAKAIQKMDDETAAKWFLEKIDGMEQAGYHGVVSSRDGKNNLWIAQNYAAARDSWEDITGKMQSVLFDYFLLKNRNMLDPKHTEIMSFKSIRELGFYMVTHYASQLEKLRADIIKNAKFKLARAALLVDNQDYKVYVVLNRLGAQKLAMGALWCTGMESTNVHYNSYTSKAMVFCIFPKNPEQFKSLKGGRNIEGTEKYQFDAGGPWFMNIADQSVPKETVRKRFPYLYTDLVHGLESKKPELEDLMNNLSQDPSLSNDPDTKTLNYNIETEIEKLGRFVQGGWMTDEERPPQVAAPEEPAPQE